MEIQEKFYRDGTLVVTKTGTAQELAECESHWFRNWSKKRTELAKAVACCEKFDEMILNDIKMSEEEVAEHKAALTIVAQGGNPVCP